MSGVDVASLIEDVSLVCYSIAVGVFNDDDSVAIGSLRNVSVSNLLSIVDDFANPNSSKVVNVDVGWVGEEGFGGKESDVEFGMDFEL